MQHWADTEISKIQDDAELENQTNAQSTVRGQYVTIGSIFYLPYFSQYLSLTLTRVARGVYDFRNFEQV